MGIWGTRTFRQRHLGWVLWKAALKAECGWTSVPRVNCTFPEPACQNSHHLPRSLAKF